MQPTIFTVPWLDITIRSYGLMLMIAFLGGTWWATRRALRVKANPDIVVNAGFVGLLASIAGARLFYVIHYWDVHFAGRGLWTAINVTAGGLEFYGGFLGALAALTTYGIIKGVSFRMYSDIIAPSVMFGMGVTRIGCFLNGCCWGAPCMADIPWSVRFPFASPAYHKQWNDRLATVPAELLVITAAGQAYPMSLDSLAEATRQVPRPSPAALQARAQARLFATTPQNLLKEAKSRERRTLSLHPTQLYSSLDGLLLAGLLSVYFYRRRRHGTVFALMLMLYAFQRFIEDSIRIDNPHDTAFLTISQFISLAIFVGGAAWWLYLRRLPLHSPRAYACAPEWVSVPAAGPRNRQTAKTK